MSSTVAVIGMGLMGAAIAAQLRSTGEEVVVWNRSPAKCEPLAALGASVAASAQEAIAAAGAIVLVTATTDDVTPHFATAGQSYAGKDVINLVTGSPSQIRALQHAVRQTGAHFLSGTIQCYPSNIGDPQASIVVGGDAGAWAHQEARILSLAGGSAYVGPKADLPNVVDASVLGCFFFSAMGASLEGTSYAAREGVALSDMRPFFDQALQLLPAQINALFDSIEGQALETADATLTTFSKSLELFRAALADVGAPDLIIGANHRRMKDALAAGDGTLGFAALSKY